MKTLQSLPFFPLALFKLPGEFIDLHVFEPRYQQLIQEMLEQNIEYFGIPCTLPVKGALAMGTLVRLSQIYKKHEDGGLDLQVEAIGVFEVLDYQERLEDKLYAGGMVRLIDYQPQIIGQEFIQKQLEALKQQYPELMDWYQNLPISDTEILGQLPFHDIEKIAYVKLRDYTKEQLKFLKYHLQQLNLMLIQYCAMPKGFCLN